MPIIYNDDGTTTLIVDYHKPGKRSGTRKRKTIKTQDQRTVSKTWAELVESVSGSSLTIRFKECVEHAVAENNGAGMMHIYDKIKDELGRYPVDERFASHYQAFISKLKDIGRSDNTLSNYKSCIRRSLNRAYLNGLINSIPIRDFGIVRKFRSRIWTEDEKTRLYAHLDPDENLFWMMHFAERNPIRKMDIVNLTQDNLVLIGPYAPYIRFQPKKTESRRPQPCTLPEITLELLQRFNDIQRRFPDCPYLFPRIIKNERYGTERWQYQGEFQMFNQLCIDSQVSDFHFHDLKHVAITHMLTKTINGQRVYTRDSLKRLGIQFSDQSIAVYDQSGAFDELAMVRGMENNRFSEVKKVV